MTGHYYDPCRCSQTCGDDGDTDRPGVCKGLPRQPAPPLVEIVLVRRDTYAEARAELAVHRGEAHP